MHPCGSSSSLLFLLPISYVFFYSLTSVFSDNGNYSSCSKNFECGNQKDIGYHFWGSTRPKGCGHPDFELDCSGEYPEMKIKGTEYRVLGIDNKAYTMRIVRRDYADNLCPASRETVAFDFSHFDYVLLQPSQNITLYYECTNQISNPIWSKYSSEFDCTGSDGFNYYVVQDPSLNPSLDDMLKEMRSSYMSCGKTVDVTVTSFPSQKRSVDPTSTLSDVVAKAIAYGFTVKWSTGEDSLCGECINKGGQCGNVDSKFMCYCPDNNQACFEFEANVSESTRKFQTRKMVIDVKKMTNSFADVVGKGGFGSVYRGKLSDGRLVAVKILNMSKETNGEDFINEVASMSRTSHVNIVCLLGFCYERTKRALIYEFIPNGSLDQYIYDKGITPSIKFETLEKIAVGVARGLEYLHRGCNTRIVHFDIKPHNILLDDDFCPKISDFGLAKLNQTKESILSMLHTRGTVGYIAPEVFSRNFGRVSHKSDVYSYGMMVLEMVGGRRNFDRGVSHTSEMYFPDWIYKQLEPDENLQLCGDLTEEEERRARKMIIVGLWCIQTYPQNRPAVSKVVEMLEGSLELLQIPPKPVLSSPNESPEFLLTTSSSVDI